MCIKSLFAKVATAGTVKNPRFELVRVLLDQPCQNGWLAVQSMDGSNWFAHRDDIRSFFPIVGV